MMANLLMALAAWTLGSVVLGTILGAIIEFGGRLRLTVSEAEAPPGKNVRLIKSVLSIPDLSVRRAASSCSDSTRASA